VTAICVKKYIVYNESEIKLHFIVYLKLLYVGSFLTSCLNAWQSILKFFSNHASNYTDHTQKHQIYKAVLAATFSNVSLKHVEYTDTI